MMQTGFFSRKKQLLQWSWVIVPMAVVVCGFFMSGQAWAVDQPDRSSVALSPVSQNFAIKAGASDSNKITVINDGTTPIEFLVYSRPYSLKNESYEPQYDVNTEKTNLFQSDAYQWIRFDKTSYSLAPGERMDVPYTVQVPVGATPGGHYGVIFVETQPPASASGSVVRKKRIGSIMRVTVDGKLIKQGQTKETIVDFWQTIPPLMAATKVENSGNVDFQATTLLTVTDLFGSVKYRSTQDFTVYPGTIYKMPVSWQNAPWFGLFNVHQAVSVLGKTTESSHYVLMAPRWLPVTVLILLVLGAGYEFLRRKRR